MLIPADMLGFSIPARAPPVSMSSEVWGGWLGSAVNGLEVGKTASLSEQHTDKRFYAFERTQQA
jgi:hypothetical protein